MTQLLTEMDGMHRSMNVFIIGATNRYTRTGLLTQIIVIIIIIITAQGGAKNGAYLIANIL